MIRVRVAVERNINSAVADRCFTVYSVDSEKMMRSYLQTGCLILGILCFLYYIGIVIYAGFHTSLSWLWLFGGSFFLLFWRLLSFKEEHPGSGIKYVTGLMTFLLIAGLMVILLVGSRIVSVMHGMPEPGLDYVIVLGAQVRGTAPSRALRRRLDRAIEYAHANPQTIMILSGGQGPDEDISEAECMYRYMTERGISAEQLILENNSTSTKENIMFSAQLLDIQNDNIGVLSNSFHVYRGVALAKEFGYEHVSGIAADSDLGMQPHNILREICCVLAEIVKGDLAI